MTDFKIGDRVTAIVNHPDGNRSIFEGDLGTICNIEHAHAGRFGVCWDNRIERGHSCSRTCEHGYGWNVYGHDIILYEEEDIDEDSFLQMIGGSK